MTDPQPDTAWAPLTVGEVMDCVGAHIRLAALAGGRRIEGTVIRGRRITGTLNVQDTELHEVDDLITSLWDLEAVGSDVVRGYQSPAVRQIVQALEEIRRGRTGVAARILG
jgi:hypothetical protein